ncbi:VirK/YbjX family protein [Rhodanobacter aciditrophus]|uniref:VirK/YbjX family protein n=1 Tax=Rhodanobacter aciditrophus TaxID=1623218 RepID=UPI003CE95A81
MVDAALLGGRPAPRRAVGHAPAGGWHGAGMACFLRSLRGRFDWRGDAAKRMLTAAKYIARSLLMFREHADFLSHVESEPALQAFRRRDPRMQERHLHRYLNLGWSRRRRLRAIRQHYRHLLAAMPAALFHAVYAEGGAPLGLLSLKDGSRLILSLQPPIFLGCEGELGIQLGDELGNPLYRIVVTVIDERTLAIGCIQGPVGATAREAVRQLTRQLHGLRPKCLMLALACVLARHWGLARVLAVGNAAHPLRNARRRFVADYDAFWQEQQGRDVGGGWYELPLRPQRRTEVEVPSQHRSAFRKREALREEAERLLVEALCVEAERHVLCAAA